MLASFELRRKAIVMKDAQAILPTESVIAFEAAAATLAGDADLVGAARATLFAA